MTMDGEIPREVCQDPDKADADKKYEDLFIIETTTSVNARGIKNMKIRDDPVYKIIEHNHNMQNI